MKLLDADFRNLADHSPLLIWVSDPEMNATYVNRSWCETTGQTEEQAFGRGWVDTVHEDDRSEMLATVQQAFHQRQKFSVDFRMRYASGEFRWMATFGSPHFDDAGQFAGYMGTVVEIHTERMLRMQAINQQSRLQQLYEKTPVLMHSIDAEGTIVSVSDAWLDHFGYSREEVIGRKRTDFMSESSRRVAAAKMKAFLRLGFCESVDYQFVKKSGEVREIKLSAIAETDLDGNFVKSIAVLEDVTDTKKSLRQLKQTQIAFDHCGEAIFWVTEDGGFLYVNQQACDTLGYSQEELKQLKLWDIDPNFTEESYGEIDWRGILAEGKIIRSHHKTRDGRVFPVEVNAKLIRVDDEAFFCAFVRDLTDLLRIDSELEQTKRRLEEALRSGNVGLWDWDMKTGEVSFSAEWKTQVGLPPDAPLDGYQSWETRVHPDDKASALARINDYLSNKTSDYRSTFRFRHEDGTYRWIRAEGRVFYDENNQPERMIGVHVDMTDQKLAEMTLAVRTAELEAIFQASPDMFLRTEKDGTIRDFRVSSDAVVLAPSNDFLGRRIHELVPRHVAENYDHAFANLEATNQSQTIEYRLRIRGDLVWHQAVIVPFQSESVAIFIRDITERKLSELVLIRRTEELERSNSDLDQFAYVASHDLKTPLRGIRHLTKWIREDAEGKLPSSCDEHLRRLDDQVERMQSLLDDLLQYSRANRVRVAVESINLDDLFQEVVELVHAPRQMKFQFENPDDIELLTGRAPLFHVLLNLVDNAVKYHDRKDGTIAVRISEMSDVEYVCFEVADDGPGIPREHHARVFRMFQRLDSKTTGTGMGLAVVRKMVEARGGTIDLVSDRGSGTKFFFTWPSMRDLPDSPTDDEE